MYVYMYFYMHIHLHPHPTLENPYNGYIKYPLPLLFDDISLNDSSFKKFSSELRKEVPP